MTPSLPACSFQIVEDSKFIRDSWNLIITPNGYGSK